MEALKDAINPAKPEHGRVERAATAVRDGFENAKERVVDGYERVNSKAHDVWDNVADKNLNDVTHSVNRYVRRHPGKCLLLAAGTGLAIGFALRWHHIWGNGR